MSGAGKPSETRVCLFHEICDRTRQCESWLRNHHLAASRPPLDGRRPRLNELVLRRGLPLLAAGFELETETDAGQRAVGQAVLFEGVIRRPVLEVLRNVPDDLDQRPIALGQPRVDDRQIFVRLPLFTANMGRQDQIRSHAALVHAHQNGRAVDADPVRHCDRLAEFAEQIGLHGHVASILTQFSSGP